MVCSLLTGIDGFSLMFLSVIVIANDGNWTPSNGGKKLCSTHLTTLLRIVSRICCISDLRPLSWYPGVCHVQDYGEYEVL